MFKARLAEDEQLADNRDVDSEPSDLQSDPFNIFYGEFLLVQTNLK